MKVAPVTRGDRFRDHAAQADRLAMETTDPRMKRELIDLAQQWRELAREADAIELAARSRDVVRKADEIEATPRDDQNDQTSRQARGNRSK